MRGESHEPGNWDLGNRLDVSLRDMSCTHRIEGVIAREVEKSHRDGSEEATCGIREEKFTERQGQEHEKWEGHKSGELI